MIPELKIDCRSEEKRIADFIADFVSRTGKDGLLHGLSGGIDSAVVALSALKALGKDNLLVLLLPERDSSKESVRDARELCEKFGIRYKLIDLEPALKELGCYETASSRIAHLKGGARFTVKTFPGLARKGYLASIEGKGGRRFNEFVAFYRIKHRLRMITIYHEAEKLNMATASCANRTEFEVGFFVKYGDDSGDIAPIKHLYKTQVSQLAEHLGVTEAIIKKRPSPDLFAGMADEDIMGIDYETLDSILFLLGKGVGDEELIGRLGVDEKTVKFVREMMEVSEPLRSRPASLL